MMAQFNIQDQRRLRVVIVGAGFGGLRAARALDGAEVHVTLIDQRNFHLFQPLLYQVATAGLSPADIASPIRSIVHGQANAEVLLETVTGVDTEKREVIAGKRRISYDSLIIATGAQHSYFGHDEWAKFAPGLKSIGDATRIRRNILMGFENAELETDESARAAQLTFCVVGGGPTGVELAGAIAELAHRVLARDFRRIDPRQARIVLIEAGARVLAQFPEELGRKAQAELERLGVQIRTGARVTHIDGDGVYLGDEKLPSKTIVWAAGVVASRAATWLGAEADRAGRVKVQADLTVLDHPEIFVIGDTAAATENEKPLPGLAPVAMQQGDYVAQVIRQRLAGAEKIKPFHYHDKGNLATVGRAFAVAAIGKFKMSGLTAWLAWLAVHIYYLIGFRNRILVLINWSWAYLTFQRGARLIVNED